MRIITFVLALLPLILTAQKKHEDQYIPRPYHLTPHFDYYNATGIKQMAMINKSKKTGFQSDTVFVESYNKHGQKVATIRYEKNHPRHNTQMIYNADNVLKQWELTYFRVKNHLTKTVFYHNKRQQKIRTLHTETRGADTLKEQIQHYKYKKKNLISIRYIINGENVISENYTYKKKRLKSSLIESYGIKKEKTYTYNSKKLLAQTEEYQLTPDAKNLMAKVYFFYDDQKRLILDSSLTVSYSGEKRHNTTRYQYNQTGELVLMEATSNDTYRNVTFTYENGKTVKELVSSNTNRSGYLQFWIPYIHDVLSNDIKYQADYIWDEKGNLTRKKMYINEELIHEVLFNVSYYE